MLDVNDFAHTALSSTHDLALDGNWSWPEARAALQQGLALAPELARKPVFVRNDAYVLPGAFVMGATVTDLTAADSLANAKKVLDSLMTSYGSALWVLLMLLTMSGPSVLPKPVALVTVRVPLLTIVPPLYVLFPARTSVPAWKYAVSES